MPQDAADPRAASPFVEVTVTEGRLRAVVRPAHVEALCEGHFPGDPIVPGAYLAGLMARAAELLVDHAPDARRHRVRAIEDCVFSRRVVPGATVEIEATPVDGAGPARRVEARVWSGGDCAARATLRLERRA